MLAHESLDSTPRSFPGMRSVLFVAACLLLLAAPVAVGGASESDDSAIDPAMWRSWFHGSSGMFKAIDRVTSEKKPMAVYFYTDWCPYCRQFERGLLSTPEVQSYFEDFITVRINPEAGPQEAQMARHYGVQGYPAFFIHSNQSRVLTQVNRMTVKAGRPVLMEADEFIAVCKQAAER